MDESPCDKVFLRSLFDDIRFPIGECNEDLVTIPYVLYRAEAVVRVPHAFYSYRFHPQSLSKSPYSEKRNVVIPHVAQLSSDVLRRYPDCTEAVQLLQLRYAYSNLITLSKDNATKRRFCSDYRHHRSVLLRSLGTFLRAKAYSPTAKLKLIFLLTGTYPLLLKGKVLVRKWGGVLTSGQALGNKQ